MIAPASATLATAGEGDDAASPPSVGIIIVAFGNAGDVVGCLRALSRSKADPPFRVLIAENGGSTSMDLLVEALSAATSPCEPCGADTSSFWPAHVRRRLFELRGADGSHSLVQVAEMSENLGYAGAINAWLRPMLAISGWRGVWILNPDTEPTPTALHELVEHSATRRKGMVGSRITSMDRPDIVRTRGLAWRRLTARTGAVDRLVPATIEPDANDIETRLDAPSGASLYVTRDLIEQIGLMDERYFLFFEDLEWGCRAKAVGALGHAHRSIVPHKGGTTIGGTGSRASVSPLSVYLEFRNRIIFVRRNHSKWLAWTVVAQMLHVMSFVAAGSATNAVVACRGLAAGLRGETGRPDRMVSKHPT
jgi:N-acetylglucosaminyl-diphospho-decaprenol L-rhamnosyltransferase